MIPSMKNSSKALNARRFRTFVGDLPALDGERERPLVIVGCTGKFDACNPDAYT
jgi:hypothetical protein